MGAVVRPSAILFEQSKQTEPCESLKQAGNGLYRDCQSPNASEACSGAKRTVPICSVADSNQKEGVPGERQAYWISALPIRGFGLRTLASSSAVSADSLAHLGSSHFRLFEVVTELVIVPRGFPSISICKEVIMAATVGPEVMARETARLIASDKVEGTAVRRSNGEKLGTIQRVMIDKRTGKVAYAVMTFGGFLGIGDEYRALPWSVLRYNERLDAYELNVTEDQLRNAPVLATGWDTGVIGRDRERNIHDYYRTSPYW